MWRYWELLTDVTIPEIAELKSAATSGARNPRDIKLDLAKRIIKDFHSDEAARDAAALWLAVQPGRSPSPPHGHQGDGSSRQQDPLAGRCGEFWRRG